VDVIAGQGTATLELLEDFPSLDVILCPIGGGGLISGTAIAAKGLKPGIRVIGVEPAGADDAYRSFKSGILQAVPSPNTIADGLRGKLSERTFALIQKHVDDVVTVSEASIVQAMRSIWEVLKIVVEPSGAVAYAALVEGKIEAKGLRVGLILTGGNLDLDELPWAKVRS
jgi:threonine dehydratase